MNLQPVVKRILGSGWSKGVVTVAFAFAVSGCNVSSEQLAGASAARPIEGDIFLPIIVNPQGNASSAITDTTTLPTEAVTDTVTYRSEPIPGKYIVVFKADLVLASSVDAVAATLAAQYGGTVSASYDAALTGFAAQFPVETSAAAVAGLQQDERVAYVEQDATITLNPTRNTITEEVAAPNEEVAAPNEEVAAPNEEVATPNEEVAAPNEEVAVPNEEVGQTEVGAAASNTLQANPTWGLDRIDQRALPLNAGYNYLPTGAGVNVYVIDTGINIAHTQFGGRASDGYDVVDGALPAADCNGHGTHVAGTIGGSTYGVAKGVNLIGVRVLNCAGSGTYSGVLAGIDWVTQQKRSNPTKPMVANMSLGGGYSAALNNAVSSSINAGVVYVVAAGNSNANACNYSPAATSNAITVGATTNTDGSAAFSNFGACVDIFAPGQTITSAWHTSNTATNTISGTSMAAPHVAGVVALYLQTQPTANPATIATLLRTHATPNRITNLGAGSPNFLLYSQ